MSSNPPASQLVQKIVVGVDFEAEGDEALVEAIQIARVFPECELHPVHALPVPEKFTADRMDVVDELLTRASDEVRARAIDLASQHLPDSEGWTQSVTVHVRLGKPAPTIHQVAVDVAATLIVVGTNARRGVDRLLFGSVAETLIRKAHLPVLVARPNQVRNDRKTERPEPPRPDEDLHAQRSFSRTELIRFNQRDTHVPGLV